jgi:hypothetical protein
MLDEFAVHLGHLEVYAKQCSQQRLVVEVGWILNILIRLAKSN